MEDRAWILLWAAMALAVLTLIGTFAFVLINESLLVRDCVSSGLHKPEACAEIDGPY